MDEFLPIRTEDGWQLTVPGPAAEPLVLQVIRPKVTDGAVKGVLVVRCGAALVSDDVLTLTSAAKRSQLIKRLKTLGITLSERAILALDEVCRVAQHAAAHAADEIATASPEADDVAESVPPPPLDELLAAIVEFLERYLVFRSPAHAVVVALWVAHAHSLAAFDVTPYLHVHSPQKRSGKTRLLELLEQLVPRPWRVAEATAATIFRKIAQDDPVILLDEVDAIWRAKESETAQALRGVLNAGYRRGTMVPRCVGKNYEKLVDFPVFGAKALAGIGRLPDTTADRSVCLVFARKKKSEVTGRFRFRTIQAEAAGLRRALATWAAAAIPALREARPDLPAALDDRAAEIWEPLLAVADAAGRGWPGEARKAAVTLSAASGEDDSVGVLLLRAIKATFDALDAPRAQDPVGTLFDGERPPAATYLLTVDVLVALVEREAEPWGGWWGADVERALEKGKSPKGPAGRLAGLLKPFEVQSRDIRTSEGTRKGYVRAEFADVFERYLGTGETPPDEAERATGEPHTADSPPAGRDNATTVAAQGFEASRPAWGSDHNATPETLAAQGLSRCRDLDGGNEPSDTKQTPSSPRGVTGADVLEGVPGAREVGRQPGRQPGEDDGDDDPGECLG